MSTKMWARDRQESRKKGFKAGVSAEDARRKREDYVVRIRKNKRKESLAKKRNIGQASATSCMHHDDSIAQELENLPKMVCGVMSEDPSQQLACTTQFKELLSVVRNPPIEEVIATGVVPRFVQFLTHDQNPQLQFEAAWALTNIASGSSEHTRIVVEQGAVRHFVRLLSSNNDDVRAQAVWALGNIAGDSSQCRDYVLQQGAMGPLLQILTGSFTKPSMVNNATHALSNLCRGIPRAPFQLVSFALPALANLLYSADEEVLIDACWTLSYLTNGSNDEIQAVIEAGVCPRMVELLAHSLDRVKAPALRTVGNIVTGDDVHTQTIISASALPCLLLLLNSPRQGIKKDACWTISNIAANKAHVQAIIDANIIPPLINLLGNAEFNVKQEALWAISNATNGSPEQIRYLVAQGCIKPLCDLLTASDARVINVALGGLENILQVGESDARASGGRNQYADDVEAAGGVDKIKNLQTHQNTDICTKAVTILLTLRCTV